MEDGGGGHWLVRMEWRLARWLVCLSLLIFPCTIKSRSSLLAPAHPGGPGKRAVKRLWCGVCGIWLTQDANDIQMQYHRLNFTERSELLYKWTILLVIYILSNI